MQSVPDFSTVAPPQRAGLTGCLVQAVKPAAKPKKQTVYFVKSHKQELTNENLNSEVCCSTFQSAVYLA